MTYKCHSCERVHTEENMAAFCAWCYGEVKSALSGRTVSCVCGGNTKLLAAYSRIAELENLVKNIAAVVREDAMPKEPR